MTTFSSQALTPFKYRVFTILWVATLLSNIGTWMFNVTAGWLMTTLSPSPFMVSLVQVATSFPIFLFALPAGALGDIFDRRALLLITQIISASIMILFAVLLVIGHSSAMTLLCFTFLAGAISAFAYPAWQAIIPILIPRESLQPAIVLNGASINIARAIGPALAGFILLAAGAIVTVLLNALSFMIVIAALLWWRPAKIDSGILPREQLTGAMRAGVRFALCSRSLRHTLIRTLAFFAFASAYWAFLPLITKELLHGGPGLYGLILASIGAGALLGTFWIPSMNQRFSSSHAVALGTVGSAVAMSLFASVTAAWIAIITGVIAGISWIIVISALNVSAQLSLPDWVRARGMAIFQMVIFGGMTLGSLFWGQVANYLGLRQALYGAALFALISMALTLRFRLNLDENRDHTPSGHWAEPEITSPLAYDRGPVLVTMEYQIDATDRDQFLQLMNEMGTIRRRDGAMQWGIFERTDKSNHFIEVFITESWIAHLRQHVRVSAADKVIQDKIYALHCGDERPIIVHAVTPHAL